MKKKLTFVIIMILSCLGANAQSEGETLVSLAKVNFESITEFTQWASTGTTVEIVDDGIAINNTETQDQSCEPQVEIVPDGSFDLKEGHDYIVRLTIKVPSDGQYTVNLGNWSTHFMCQAPVTAQDDFQIIDVEYPEYERSVTDCHVLLDCGWVPGTTIVKEVEVFERLGYWSHSLFVELTPDKSIVYKFVLAMDNKSREVMDDLYASMKKVGDKSIFKCTETGAGGWYVKNDFPLPEGNFFESLLYNANSYALDGQLIVILPKFNFYVNWRGRVEELLEYLGDRVTADYISKPDHAGGITCHFTCNLKTSDEALKLGMSVEDMNFEGVTGFGPRQFWIDKTYNSHLISMMTDSNKNEDNLIYSMNWEGVNYPMTDIYPDDPWKTTDEGLAIVNPEMQEYAGKIGTFINARGFNVEENHDYVVRMTMKVPSDGKYFVRMGHGEATCLQEVSVIGSDDWQTIDVQFPDFLSEMKGKYYDPIDGNASIFLSSGWVVGTTIVKKVEVFEMTKSGSHENKTAIKTIKAINPDATIYNISGQRVTPSYKGIVIRNGRKVVN